jgi:hypothetical protein
MPAPVLQIKRGAAADVGIASLRAGEPGFTTDKYDFYIGLDATAANQKFFGSARYWKREDTFNSAQLKLVDKNGTNSINLKSPDTLSGITTYTLPETPTDGYFLKTNTNGTLSWEEVVSDFSIAGDTGTDVVSTGSTITFTGGEGIDTSVTDNTVTISAELASDTNAGIASFNSGDFTVTSGNVVLANSVDGAVLAINGTTSEVEVSRSNGTVTVGLPDTVNIATLLDVPTVEATNLKARDGTTAITITNTTGAVGVSSDLTVGGNLYVNGNTTQVNTTSLTVKDRTIDLGIVNGSAPSSSTTWDLGILFNYFTEDTAKKSAVIWEHVDTRFKFATVLAADTNGTDANTPQLSVTTFAPIEIGALWVNDCAGASQVISCTETTRNLENITVDGGEY